MLVRFMPELGKYAMNSLTVMLLFLLVFVSTVTKDILEANEHDELLQYIIVECISLYSQQLVEFCKYLSEDSIIIFRLCGKRNDEVSVSCDKYFSDETMTKFIDKIDEEYRKMRENS